MILKLNNNEMKASDLAVSAVGYISETAVLRAVKVTYAKDSDGNKTNVIESSSFICVDPINYASFTLKVNGARIFITPEALEEAEELVYIDIPVSETIIKPYSIEYGKAKVSIIAPYIKVRAS